MSIEMLPAGLVLDVLLVPEVAMYVITAGHLSSRKLRQPGIPPP